MRIVATAVLALFLGFSLTGCFAVAVGAAGAGGGYIYKEKENQGKVP